MFFAPETFFLMVAVVTRIILLLFIYVKLVGMHYHLNLIQQMLDVTGLSYIGDQLICKTSNMFWETSVAQLGCLGDLSAILSLS